MIIDKNYFARQKFTTLELENYHHSIRKNLQIASNNQEPEIKFHFTYMALLKIGIYILARNGYRVKSRPGHHHKIIEAMSELLSDENILIIGDKMRKDRNLDIYSPSLNISAKTSRECFDFVEKLYKKILAHNK